jgi:hypothetical protein
VQEKVEQPRGIVPTVNAGAAPDGWPAAVRQRQMWGVVGNEGQRVRAGKRSLRLFLENHRGSAYPVDLEGHIDFDAVGYLDEWDPAIHSKFLAVKSHAALN